jgi:hypothetical protein
LADRPELVEGRSAFNRWLIDLLRLIDVVCASVTINGSDEGQARAWVVVAVVFKNIVFDKRVSGPAVDRKVGITRGIKAAREGNIPITRVFRTFISKRIFN